jgi:hypothetical protein
MIKERSAQRSKPDKFSRSFSSEALLQQAIAGLLTRVPDVSGVQILQGAQELGKDLVFYIRGGFGEPIPCACVVKNSKVTGDAGKTQGARTVLLQVQQALDSPHMDGFGNDIYIQRVYIVTPFDLPPSTISSIRGRLRERQGQIAFIGGPHLFDLFRQYWPDYLADESTAIEHHLKRTRQGIEEDNPILALSTQYDLGEINPNEKRVYVPQRLHRDICSYSLNPTITTRFSGKSRISEELPIEELKDILNDLRRLARAVRFLSEWNEAADRKSIAARNHLELLLSNIVPALQEQLDEQFNLNNLNNKIDPHCDTSLTLKLRGAESFTAQLIEIVKQRDAAISALQKNLKRIDAVITGGQHDGIESLNNLDFLYACRLDDCAHVAPKRLFYPGQKRTISFPKDILDKWTGPLLIVGTPGYGKTSFCRWNALRDTERFSSGKSRVIPVYLPLHRLSRTGLVSFDETFLQGLGRSALLTGADRLNTSRDQTMKIRFYLDGLDEVASTTQRRDIMDMVRKNAESSPNYQIIVTARNHVYGPWLDWLPRISLGSFDQNEINEFVVQWLGKNSRESEAFLTQLRDVPVLSGLMRIPLLATLIILVFRRTGRLPENKTRLYQIFVELLSGGWDIAKGVIRESRFGQRIKLMVLRSLAAKAHGSWRSVFGDEDIKSVIGESLSKALFADWEAIRDELIEDGLVSRSGDVLHFSHLSFQEFLMAKDLISDPVFLRANHFLELFIYGDDWWREVLGFYLGLTEKPREALRWLLSVFYSGSIFHADDPEPRLIVLLDAFAESYPEFRIENLADYAPESSYQHYSDFFETLSQTVRRSSIFQKEM